VPRDRQGSLLLCGVVGPPLFFAIFTVAGALRPGYSAVRDYVSTLSVGDQGWVQRGNFILFGLLMLGFAVGARSALRTGKASVAGPILLAVVGAGLVMAGTFEGVVHLAAAVVVFVALAAACFVFARRFIGEDGRRGFGVYSIATGVAVPVLYVLTSSPIAQTLGVTGAVQRVTVAIGWGWIVLVALRLRRQPTYQVSVSHQ
jgi:hypothetical membrane protein